MLYNLKYRSGYYEKNEIDEMLGLEEIHYEEMLKLWEKLQNVSQEEYETHRKFHTMFEEELVNFAKVLSEKKKQGELVVLDDEEDNIWNRIKKAKLYAQNVAVIK